MAREALRRLVGLTGAMVAFGACAGEATADFQVSVRINPVCVSQVLSDATQAEVKVFCPTGQFVQIEADPGKPFVGTHGGAHRFNLPSNALPSGMVIANADPLLGSGTVASLRVTNLQGETVPLEVGGLVRQAPEVAREHPELAGGTVTSLRVYNIDGDERLLEMLVTF